MFLANEQIQPVISNITQSVQCLKDSFPFPCDYYTLNMHFQAKYLVFSTDSFHCT